MNKRIQALADEAEAYADSVMDRGGEFHTAYTKRLAELIVRECVVIVSKRKNQSIDDGWNVDEAMSMAEMDLEEHFGVEQ